MSDWFPKQTLGSLPDRAAERWGDREALVFGERRWTFSQLQQDVDRAARGMIACGVESGDKVAVWMTNRPEWVVLAFAIAKVGACCVPLNTRYRTADVGYTIRQSDTSTLITLDRSGPVDYLGMLREAVPQLGQGDGLNVSCPDFPLLKRVIVMSDDADTRHEGTLPYREMLERGARIDDAALAERADGVDPDSLLLIAYTSGTTGDPKGVMHTHKVIRNVTDCANRMGITFEDAILNYLPMFHTYAYSSCSMMSLITGAKQVLLDVFDADLCCDLIEREKGSVLHGFDTHYRDIMDAQAARPRDLSSLRIGGFPAGSESSTPVAERTQTQLCPTLSGYGMTEVWTFSALSFPNSTLEQRVGASGFPSAGYEFKIIDPETGDEQPANVPGEILMRGYMVTEGYYKKPDATAETIKDGWLHSGDTGLMRPDGHLQFLGRYKDMLKVGGENVSPAEVEGYLQRLDGVANVAVVGAPDPRLMEIAVAFVVLDEGSALTADDVLQHCKGKIASFKIPKHIFFIDALPMTPTGKIQKHKLRDQAKAEIGN